MYDPIEIITPANEIDIKRTYIASQLLSRSLSIKEMDFKKIDTDDLKTLFFLYDKVFLNGWFWNYKNYWYPRHTLSTRMTSAAGKCIRKKTRINYHYEIRISVDFFFNHGRISETATASGIVTNSSLQALQVVYEHELCHLLEFIYYGDSECKNDRFKKIASQIFGHKSSYHALPSYKDIAKKEKGIGIGSVVNFEFEDEILEGVVKRITKRATCYVYTPHGHNSDEFGKKYNRYYVPVNQLHKVEHLHVDEWKHDSMNEIREIGESKENRETNSICTKERWMDLVCQYIEENQLNMALKIALEAASDGIIDAQRTVGNMYTRGVGTPQNHEEAISWYTRAAEQGDYKSQHNLGIMYFQGSGVIQNYYQASLWFEKAAEQGSVADQLNLGIMYETGNGVSQNYDKAELWYMKANDQKHPDAQDALDQIRAKKNNVDGSV